MRFLREASLRIQLINGSKDGYTDTLTITGLRISFSIQKSMSWSLNSANIRIWNLGQDNRNALANFGDRVTLYAGYEGEAGTQVLFIGDTSTVYHMFDQPEIITVLECGDGELTINNPPISLAYASSIQARQIITDVAAKMGLAIATFAQSENLVYRQGYNDCRPGREILADICAKINLQPLIQENKLYVIPIKSSITETPIVVNESTGMQGIPQRFTYKNLYAYRAVNVPNTGYKINVQLNPLVFAGSRILFSSQKLGVTNAPYLVENVRHEGDTFGFLWTSQLQCTEITT